MGKLNLLKGRYTGKVGETVGAKWKDKSTLRTFSIPSNPRTSAQQSVRTVFADMTAFVALFADQIKYLSALNTSGMSVRNAIIKLNKDQISAGTFDKASLEISRGGLQKPTVSAPTFADGIVTLPFTAPTATNFTNDAKIIVVFVDAANSIVDVKEAGVDAGTVASANLFTTSEDVDVYAYYLDKRGSSKIASVSVYQSYSA